MEVFKMAIDDFDIDQILKRKQEERRALALLLDQEQAEKGKYQSVEHAGF